MDIKSHKTPLNTSGNHRGLNPNSLKNLGKGRKGNNFARKDYSITRIIKEMLDDKVPDRFLEVEDKDKQFTFRQAIAKRILLDSVRGNAKVTSELLDRLEGKVTQPISGDKDNPVLFTLLGNLRGFSGNGDPK